MSATAKSAWVAERDTSAAAAIRLFCLPHAGSGAAGFYRWQRLLPGSVAVCPVQLPGRERRLAEPAAVRLVPLVTEILEAIRPSLERPYAIFGHSMGSMLAFELSRQIAAAGLPLPVWLFVSGRQAPQLPPVHEALFRLENEALLRELGLRYGGAPHELLADPELRALFLPVLRADIELVETYGYAPGPPLGCALGAFAGVEDSSLSAAGLAAWREQTTAEFVQKRFAGDHYFHFAEGQAALLETMAGLLAS